MQNKKIWLGVIALILVVGGVSAFYGSSSLNKGSTGALITNQATCTANSSGQVTCTNPSFTCNFALPALTLQGNYVSPDGPLNADQPNAKAEIKFNMSRQAYVTVIILRNGTMIREIIRNVRFDAAQGIGIDWDGKANGTKVAAGTYTYRIIAGLERVTGYPEVSEYGTIIRVVTGNITVARTAHLSNRVVIAQPATFNPDAGQTTSINLPLSRPGYVWVAVKSQSGSPVKNIKNGEQMSTGNQSVSWDGKDAGGQTVGPGTYRIFVSVSDTASGDAAERQDTIATVQRNCNTLTSAQCRQNTTQCEEYNTGSILDPNFICRNKTVARCESITVTATDADSLGLGNKHYRLSIQPSNYSGTYSWVLNPGSAGRLDVASDTKSATGSPSTLGFNANASITITSADSACTKRIYAANGMDVGTGPAPTEPAAAPAPVSDLSNLMGLGNNFTFPAPAPDVPVVPAAITITNVSADSATFTPANNQSTTLRFTTNYDSNVSITIKNSAGATVTTMGGWFAAGARSMSWNGKNSSNQIVPAGTYTATIAASAGALTPGTANVNVTVQAVVVAAPDTPPADGVKIAPFYAYPNPFNADTQSTSVRFTLNKDAQANITITREDGSFVRRLLRNARLNRGFSNIPWDAKDEIGEPVPAGNYIFKLEVATFESQPTRDTATGTFSLQRN